MKKQSILLIAILLMVTFMFGCALSDKSSKEPAEKALTDLENVTYVQYKNAEGTVTFVKAEDKWSCEENAELTLVHAYVDDRVKVLGHIEGTVVENAKKSECGLDEPAYTLTIKNAEKTVKVFIGMNEDYELYAMVDGEDAIYSIHDDVIEVLDMGAEQFAEPSGDVYSYLIDTEEEALIEDEYEESDDIVLEDEPIEELPEEETSEDDVDTEE